MKAALIATDNTHVASFEAERLSTDKAAIEFTYEGKTDTQHAPNYDHETALKHILKFLENKGLLDRLVATGHRVVHGGAKFTESVIVDDKVLEEIQSVSHLAPLHNPHNIAGIKALRDAMPRLPVVAVFDTSFHTTIPEKAKTYPIPKRYREKGIQKYGFHGTSVRYVVQKAMDALQKMKSKEYFNLVVCHLGNGASVTAVSGGKSVETSMGFSPLPGLMMGTRSGSVDPAIVQFAAHSLDLSVDQVLNDLNKESGLKAMVDDPDMRSIRNAAEEGNEDAQLAIDMFVYRVVQYIANSLVALPGQVDAIIFTGGIGEHASQIRAACAEALQKTILPGLALDKEKNQAENLDDLVVLTEKGAFPVCIQVATDEEAMIAQDCFRLIESSSK